MKKRSLLYTLPCAMLVLSAARCGSSPRGAGGPEGAGAGDGAPGTGSSTGVSGSGSGTPSGSGSGALSGAGLAMEAGTGSGSGSSGAGIGSGGDAGTGGPQSVLQRGGDVFRRATFTEPGLTASSVATMKADTTFDLNATFPMNGKAQNQGTASVLYLEDGPAEAGCPAGATGCTATARAASAGLFFAFPALGSNPNVVAFDETTGLPVWTAHVTTGSDGIRGTPVVDPASRRLFVVTGNNPHLVHALSVDDGIEVTTGGWPVTLSKTTLTYNDAGSTRPRRTSTAPRCS